MWWDTIVSDSLGAGKGGMEIGKEYKQD